jgi:hypothetical protein
LAHLHFQLEALEDAAHRVMNMGLDLFVGQTGHVNLAHLGKVHGTGAVHGDLGVEVDLSPDTDYQLIARAEDVAWGNIHFAQGCECCWYLAKERVPIHGK